MLRARTFRRGLWFLALVACATHLQASESEGPGRAYLRAFRHHLDLAEQNVPHIAELADGVADRFIERGNLEVCPTQESFIYELIGRASGPTSLQGWRRGRKGQDSGVVLMALGGAGVAEGHRAWLNRGVRRSAAQVVVFASRPGLAAVTNEATTSPFDPSDFYGFVDNNVAEDEFTFQVPGPEGNKTRRAQLSSVINTLNGWLFLGELTAACTRRGRMPNYWISFGIDRPRGYVRKLRYEGDAANDQVPFHSDFDVSPLPAEWVGRRYIGHLRSYLDRLERWPDLREAAERITAKLQQGRKVYFFSIGHMFPHEAPPDERAGPLTVMEAGHAQRVEAVQRVGQPGDMLFLLCMPTFDDEMVGAALGKGMEVIAVSGAPPPTALEQEKDLYWIAAPWPITDGCVEIPGYDMAILPVTGVMNAAIYYSVRSQVEYELALVED